MKFPFMQFVPKEWLSDPQVSICRPATRGIWIDAISAMHEMDRCGQLVGTLENLARVCRCRVDEMRAAVDDLRTSGAADVAEQNAIVTLVNRRMRRLYEDRQATKNRVDRHRSKKSETEDHRQRNASVTDLKRCINHNQNHKKNPPTPQRGASFDPIHLVEKCAECEGTGRIVVAMLRDGSYRAPWSPAREEYARSGSDFHIVVCECQKPEAKQALG